MFQGVILFDIPQKDIKNLGKKIDGFIDDGIGIGKGIFDSVFE